MGGAQSQDMAADAGKRCRAQIQAEEAGGWQVQATSRWTAICSGRGGGDKVQDRGAMTINATDGGI